MNPRIVGILIGLAIGGIAASGIVWWQIQQLEAESGAAQGGGQGLVQATEIGGPFTLTNHRGETVTEADFRGKFMLVYFGFTYCPDICPTELGTMAAALDRLPEPIARRVTPVFVTIDPERDEVEAMADYVAMFHPRMVGLTGTPQQISQIAEAYKVYYAKVDDPELTQYTMDHSSFVYLMGPRGKFLDVFSYGTSPEVMAKTIRQHVQVSAG